MKRKVNRLGPVTLSITLPAKWVKENNVSKGDELDVEPKEKELIIRTEGEKQPLKTTLDISNLAPFSRRCIDAIYKKGYDEVEILFKKQSDLADIEKAINLEARTFEIVKQGDQRCTIKSISEPPKEEFEMLLRRTFILLKEMSTEILDALKEQDRERIRNAETLEHTNNKLTHLMRRMLNKEGYAQPENTTLIYCIVEELEKIADELKFLLTYLADNPTKHKEILTLFEEVNSFIALFYEVFYKYDHTKAVELYKLRKHIVSRSMDLMKKLPNQECIILHYLINVTNFTFDMFGPFYAMRY